jgi:NAD(P)-dependent dehydrogenase (short-subunit alcohol dehydrogenase family)
VSAVCLRDGLLAGRVVVRSGAAGVGDMCVALGADVVALCADLMDEEALAAEVAAIGGADSLVAGAAEIFAAAGGGYDALRAGLDGTWNAVRAVATGQLIERGGKIVLLAPAPGAGEHAGALRAALENTARTLSTEWTRHGLTSVAVLPGDATTAGELAQTVAFLVSEAGDYYSGCALTLA